MKKHILFLLLIAAFFLSACDKSQQSTEKKETTDNTGYKQITWQDLEAPSEETDSNLKKFNKEIRSAPNHSIEGKEAIRRMQASLNAAPVNTTLDKKKIKLAGYISPIEVDSKEGKITEFLLVPYFGACIHVPPPPLNQVLYVKPSKEQQISFKDSFNPVWVSGVIHVDSTVTKLAEAGYKLSDVTIEPYREKP